MDKHLHQIATAFEVIQEIKAKRANYVHFDIVLSNDHKTGAETERYNIYTSDIGHNNFMDYHEFLAFIRKLVDDEQFYKTRNIERLKEDLSDAKRRKSEAEDDIAEYEKTLKAAEVEV